MSSAVEARPGLAMVFFDVGRTLGELDQNNKLVAYARSPSLLSQFRDVLGLRVGVLSNLPDWMSTEQLVALLEAAGLAQWIERDAVITSKDAKTPKPERAVYEYAAKQVGLPLQCCLYAGENEKEVRGAIEAGMAGLVVEPPRSA